MQENNEEKTAQDVIIICPGRGSYTKDTLGYLSRAMQGKSTLQNLHHQFDIYRTENGLPTHTELDQSSHILPEHYKGEHASSLIYSCSLFDYLTIDRKKFRPVAIIGNSMGWYSSLAIGGALSYFEGLHLVQTMGQMMQEKLIGGQLIYQLVDDNWQMDSDLIQEVQEMVEKINDQADSHQERIYTSIQLGGFVVFAGDEKVLKMLAKKLKKKEPYPFKLLGHGAFHTPLMNEISKKAKQDLPLALFNRPQVPLIDGTGKIWSPYSTDIQELYDYTLGAQVTETYSFTKSLEVALKEFGPQKLILLGPGTSIGGAILQVLIQLKWQGIKNKKDVLKRQKKDPFLFSMGMEEQRKSLILEVEEGASFLQGSSLSHSQKS